MIWDLAKKRVRDLGIQKKLSRDSGPFLELSKVNTPPPPPQVLKLIVMVLTVEWSAGL